MLKCFGCMTLLGFRNKLCEKLVYFPPDPKSYDYDAPDSSNNSVGTMWMIDGEKNKYNPISDERLKVDFAKTRRGNTVCCMYITCPGSNKSILFAHGNAADIGLMRDHLIDMSERLQVNIMCYDYSGYGMSTGKPNPANTYADADAAYELLTMKYANSAGHKIILYGQSLGSGPSLYLGSTRANVDGIVIHSGLLSGLRVIREVKEKTPWFDIYPNVDTVKKCTAPVFVIHGTEDVEIPINHGIGISENAQNAFPPWFVEGAGHNNIEAHWRETYFAKTRQFLNRV